MNTKQALVLKFSLVILCMLNLIAIYSVCAGIENKNTFSLVMEKQMSKLAAIINSPIRLSLGKYGNTESNRSNTGQVATN